MGKENLPKRAGVYLAKGIYGNDEWEEIEVYRHPVKGLSVFADDFGSGGTGVNDKYDCHVSVQNSGLDFGKRIRNLTGKCSK